MRGLVVLTNPTRPDQTLTRLDQADQADAADTAWPKPPHLRSGVDQAATKLLGLVEPGGRLIRAARDEQRAVRRPHFS